MSQKLRTHIDTFNKVYGDTKDGADWCIKALHPSDPGTEIRGIPDQTAVPTLLMNYQTTATISPRTGATGTWSFDSVLLPHPIQFMHLTQYDSVSVSGLDTDIMNSQIDGATHAAKYKSMLTFAQRWRLAYMSVTVYQDGPDLANQGTIVVAQSPVNAMRASFSYQASTVLRGTCPILSYTTEDMPNFAASQSMPNAYFNRSRDGAYVPLKLTETTQDWFSEEDTIGIAQSLAGQSGKEAWRELPVTDVPAYPFTSLQPTYFDGTRYGEVTSNLLQSNWAFICARNLSVQTSYSFYVRCGIEMMVSPSSTLAPQLKLSPMYDPRALDTYFAIARELKDAYPADYNDLGKIWRVISNAVKKVAPVAKFIPIPGVSQIATAAENVAAAGDAIQTARQNRRKRKAKPAQRAETPRPPVTK